MILTSLQEPAKKKKKGKYMRYLDPKIYVSPQRLHRLHFLSDILNT